MIRNLGWLALHHGLGRALTLVFFLALPVMLPMPVVGQFTLLYTALLVLSQPLFEGPLELLLTTTAAGRSPASARRVAMLVGRALPLLLIAGWIVGELLGTPRTLLALLIAQLGLARAQGAVFAALRGLERPKLEGVIGATQRALTLGLLLPATRLLTDRPEGPALAMVLGVAGGWLLTLMFFRSQLVELYRHLRNSTEVEDSDLESSESTRRLREAMVLGAAGLVGALYLRVDVLLLGWLSDAAVVGRYFTASRLLEASYALPHLLMLALLPRLVRTTTFGVLFRRAAVVMVALGGGAALLLAGLAPLLLPRLYPDQGGAIASLVVALAPAAVAVFLGFLATQGLVVLGRPKAWLLLALGGLVVDIGLNLLLIPSYGARGAAWATVATEAVVAVPAALLCLRAAAKGPAAKSSATSS